MLLLLPSLFKAPDILQKVEEYTGHCIVPEGVVCTPLTLIPTLGLLCFVGAILSPATPASYNQLQTTTNNNVVTTKMSTSVPHTTSYSYNLDELYLGLPRATETVVGVNTIQDPAIELHLTATDVVITPYMQRRLNATTTMDVDEAVDRITASGSCMITDVPSATDMIWEESVLTNSSVVHFPLHTTNVDSTMFSTTIGLPTSPAAARTFVVLMQNMDQTEHTHDAMRKNPAWPHNIMLVPNNNYGEMKYFILLKYLNLMRNGYPCNLLN